MALLRQIVIGTGTSALVVSHDLHVLERLCDRVAILDGGRIEGDHPVGELRACEVHPTTAALLSTIPPILTNE